MLFDHMLQIINKNKLMVQSLGIKLNKTKYLTLGHYKKKIYKARAHN